jgi:hypothetical protein
MTDAELIAEAYIACANWKLGPGDLRDVIEKLANALERHQPAQSSVDHAHRLPGWVPAPKEDGE